VRSDLAGLGDAEAGLVAGRGEIARERGRVRAARGTPAPVPESGRA
jgi:hypothetical protein